MRLIDADKLPWVDRVILVDQVDGDINITIAKEYTSYVNDETPTVKAIPIEWVEKWVDMLKKRNYHSYQVLMPALIEMLEDWNEENGRSE